ncbi:hypothetical protein GQ53DRAFT_772979 [Thozetella sp. PMI_491]|nr:hypothetical protein GQ53DRAFT_772979 [Thozetella sp. PMI_491]
MLRYQLITLLAALLTASGATSTPRDVKARAQARERVAPRTAIASCGSLGNNEVTFSVNSVDFISQIFLIPVGISEQQIHFTVTNTASTVSTDCILSNFMLDDHWSDQGTTWHSCLNQTITADDNETYTVLTSTLFDWTQFIATVNQTWACKGESLEEDKRST